MWHVYKKVVEVLKSHAFTVFGFFFATFLSCLALLALLPWWLLLLPPPLLRWGRRA